MIIDLLVNVILALVSVIFVFLPTVTIASIPYVGTQISTTLIWAISTWNAFLVTFPYAEVVWQMFLWVVIPLEIGILIEKFFLGHRTPNSAH